MPNVHIGRINRSVLSRRAVALASAVTLAGPVLAETTQAQAQAQAQERPNVLLFLVDDLGYSDLGIYGGEINTPNIDTLAQSGLQFTSHYVQPRCRPTRASLLSGQQNHAVGFDVLIGDNQQLRQNHVMLPELLQANGYDTYLSGKWHLGNTDNFGRIANNIPGNDAIDPRVRGFDSAFTFVGSGHSEDTWAPGRYRLLSDQVAERTYTVSNGTQYSQGQTFYQTDAITDYALDFINHSRTNTNTPWFTYVAYGAPHFPLQAPKELVDSYVDRYSAGWDAVRSDRLQAMIDRGIVDAGLVLPSRNDVPGTPQSGEPTHQIRAWDSLSPERQADLARRMAIYAAMVDTMDQGVGRIVDDFALTASSITRSSCS